MKMNLRTERRRRAASKLQRQFRADFGARLRKATFALALKQRRPRVTCKELAAFLTKQTGKAVTARRVGRFWRGVATPETRERSLIEALADFLNVNVSWLFWGTGRADPPERGVYETSTELTFYDYGGYPLGTIRIGDLNDRQAAINKAWALLDVVSPLRPTLRLEPRAQLRNKA